MTTYKDDQINNFITEMNESAGEVGSRSAYYFNKFREGMGNFFILVTTVAIAFILAEFVRSFGKYDIFGIDTYYIAIIIGLVVGGYIAYWAEIAKIATIKGIVFSVGWNQILQILATLSIVLTLILGNSKGIQKIADFSLRYMNSEVEQGVIFKIKQKKIEAHKISAKIQEIDTSDIAALMRSRASMEQARDKEIKAREALRDVYINNHDKRAYRTMIAIKKGECAKDTASITEKWRAKLAKIDWSISVAKTRNQNAQRLIAEQTAMILDKADKASDDLTSFYKEESSKNKSTVEKYSSIGITTAIAGEVIDGLLALILFGMVKTNPNIDGTPRVKIGSRPLYENEEKTYTQNNKSSFYLKSQSTMQNRQNSRVGKSLFKEIDKVAKYISINNNRYIHGYLKHATQKEIISEFEKNGKNVTPLQIGKYIEMKGEDLIFINQKKGFVYNKEIKQVA